MTRRQLERLAVVFMLAILLATVALVAVNLRRLAQAAELPAPVAAPDRPPRDGAGREEGATTRPTAPACEWNRYDTPRNCNPERRPAEPGGRPR